MLLDNAVLQRGCSAHTAAKSNLVALTRTMAPGFKGAGPGALRVEFFANLSGNDFIC